MSQPARSPETANLFALDVEAFVVVGPGDESWLLPQEAAIVAEAVPGRRREFAAGRACARAALDALGMPSAPLLRGDRRSPMWPSHAIGSITHTGPLSRDDDLSVERGRRAYAAAVAAHRGVGEQPRTSVGLDVERIGRVSDAVAGTVFGDQERAWLSELDATASAEWATAVFSAKEAFYKAQWPVTEAWVGFRDVAVSVRGNELNFAPTPTSTEVAATLESLSWPPTIRWRADEGCVIAGATVQRARQ